MSKKKGGKRGGGPPSRGPVSRGPVRNGPSSGSGNGPSSKRPDPPKPGPGAEKVEPPRVEEREPKKAPRWEPPPPPIAAQPGGWRGWANVRERIYAPANPIPKQRWGLPLLELEKFWTWFEARLLVLVIISLITSMVFWVGLQGMASPIESQSKAGMVFRALIGVIALGTVGWVGSGWLKTSEIQRILDTVGLAAIGGALAPYWRETGVEYFGHVQNWLQEGSTFTMFGQLRGVSTRLTVLLAFIGGSLAAASGKHINIDIALRVVPPRLKLPVYVSQSLATIAFCFAASWAFFDYIAITNFNADSDAPAAKKYEIVDTAVSQQTFLMRKQLAFDFEAAKHVLAGNGNKWDDEDRYTGRQWNQFLEESGYRDHFTAEQVQSLKSPDEDLDSFRLPQAVGPEGTPRNILVPAMNLTFAAGFIFIAFRFLLRLLLVCSGHNSMEAEMDFDPDADPQRHKEREETAKLAAHETGKDVE